MDIKGNGRRSAKTRNYRGLKERESLTASKRMMLFLIIFYFCSCDASIFSHSNTSTSVDIQEKCGTNNGMELDNSLRMGGAKGIARRSAISHGARGRGNGGRSGSGNGGDGSTSPRTPGGAAVIPVYGAAGAANNHKTHINSGKSYQSSTGLITTLTATILHHFSSLYRL